MSPTRNELLDAGQTWHQSAVAYDKDNHPAVQLKRDLYKYLEAEGFQISRVTSVEIGVTETVVHQTAAKENSSAMIHGRHVLDGTVTRLFDARGIERDDPIVDANDVVRFETILYSVNVKPGE